jgi:hypothetical protein
MSLLLILKLLLVLFFLIAFLRRPSLTWGVGLLTVTTAVLLDTFLGAFDREQLEAELGFLYYAIAGALFSGAAFWLFSLLLPQLRRETAPALVSAEGQTFQAPVAPVRNRTPPSFPPEQGFDRQMLYEEIRSRFGRDDVLDLMFDLNLPESEVMPLNQDLELLVCNIMDATSRDGATASLALAVERTLTPPPPEHLPRLERLSPESPPTVLRQYLLAHYDLSELQAASAALDIDWEQLDNGNKKNKVRSLLFYLSRRNRIGELITWMQSQHQMVEEGTAEVAPQGS